MNKLTSDYTLITKVKETLKNEKNYAIIAPTVREEGPRIVSDLDNLMSKLKL